MTYQAHSEPLDSQRTAATDSSLKNGEKSDSVIGPGGIARPFSTQIISVNRDVKQISVGFKKVTVEASEMTVGYMTV